MVCVAAVCVAGAAEAFVAAAFVAGDFVVVVLVLAVLVVAVVAAASALAVSVSVLVLAVSVSVLFSCFGVSEKNSYIMKRSAPCTDMCRRRHFFFVISEFISVDFENCPAPGAIGFSY